MNAPLDAIGWHQRIGARFSDRYLRSAAFRERLRVWTRLVEAHVKAGASVLDAGCGPGALSCVAARRCAQVEALDASSNMVALARQRALEAGIENISFQNGAIGDDALLAGRRFDAILCSSVLEYVENLDGALGWLAERLAPEGVLLVSMPNGRSCYRWAERAAFRVTGRPRYLAYVRHFPSVAQFRERLRRHGLEPRETAFYAAPAWLRRFASRSGWSERVEPLFVMAARREGSRGA
jgi:2-polyprenyl-6-hydroxyphenyl methylase/3-demethylubiquinone-9 3-methyltransferase